jgi:catechol 2,3-dioxygenase
MNLNHLHLKVRDVERSRAFYSQHFGLREHVTHGHIVFMTDDARFDLALASSSGDVEPLPAWFHLGFRLSSAGDVRQAYARFMAAGVTVTHPLEIEEDMVWFRCADPDGYAIEVYWES